MEVGEYRDGLQEGRWLSAIPQLRHFVKQRRGGMLVRINYAQYSLVSHVHP